MKKIFHCIFLFFKWTWKFLSIGLTLISSLIMLSFLAMILFATHKQPLTTIPHGAALVLSPRGDIVEQKSPLDPMSKIINNMAGIPLHEELLLQDAIDAIQTAAVDDRIKLLVINPDHMAAATLNQLQDIGQAIETFKTSGKVVIAMGDNFNQGQYYLASWSDEIYLNPMGSVDLHGFGVFRLYVKELLNKLSVNFHVFKVGTFKSALEPFMRTDMSPEAKKANQLWLSNIWNQYCEDIADHRGIPPRAINNAVNKLAENMRLTNGDAGQMALNNGLIDGLKTHEQMRAYLKNIVGGNHDKSTFQQISLYDYLSVTRHSYASNLAKGQPGIGIIVAQGNIVYDKGTVGQIGSSNIIRQIQKARKNKQVKAIVLRVDSGGGSAFASELIRQELLLTRDSGKPVVVSMGSMAASGAYWISADANKIFASPMTLTGSIGIFGAMPTFENTLAKIGVYNDGTGTTELAGAGNPTRALPVPLQTAIQSGVERGYRQFINIVAKGRKLAPEKVEAIAQGRVWDGRTAQKIGLVDQLGNLKDAVHAAAQLSGVPPENAFYMRNRQTPAAELLKSLGAAATLERHDTTHLSALVALFLQQFTTTFDFLDADDPRHLYSHCLLATPASLTH